MADITIATAAAHFGRSVERNLERIEQIIADSRDRGVNLLVLPDAAIGGYVSNLREPDLSMPPPSVELDGPELSRVAEAAQDMVVCLGISERTITADGVGLHNSATCLTGDGILGVHRKVHLPMNESRVYQAGDRFDVVDTPIGRLGMLIDYDKAFPESARTLAMNGAEIICCVCAWPASTTNRADRLVNDRQSRLFDLYDLARAAENQVFVATSNLTGVTGDLRFLGQAKIVDPAGAVLARTAERGALAVTTADLATDITRARMTLDHLRERRCDAYDLSNIEDASRVPFDGIGKESSGARRSASREIP